MPQVLGSKKREREMIRMPGEINSMLNACLEYDGDLLFVCWAFHNFFGIAQARVGWYKIDEKNVIFRQGWTREVFVIAEEKKESFPIHTGHWRIITGKWGRRRKQK